MIIQMLLVFLLWLVMLGWRVLKAAVFLAVLWGAIASLTTNDIPVLGDVINLAKSTKLDFFGGVVLSWIAENWMTFAIIMILLTTLQNRWTLKELSETGGYTRTFIATIMNYFEVQTETPSMKKMQEQGFWSIIRDGIQELWWSKIIGFMQPHDDRLEAKAVRQGDEVRFSDDIKKAVGTEAPNSDNEIS